MSENKLQSLPMSPQFEQVLRVVRESDSKCIDILFDGFQYQILFTGKYIKPEDMPVLEATKEEKI